MALSFASQANAEAAARVGRVLLRPHVGAVAAHRLIPNHNGRKNRSFLRCEQLLLRASTAKGPSR
jgi:hypothetical protein